MFNNLKKSIVQNKVAVGASALIMTTASQAAVTAPDFTSNGADLAILLTAMVGFGAIVWGARKLLGFAS